MKRFNALGAMLAGALFIASGASAVNRPATDGPTDDALVFVAGGGAKPEQGRCGQVAYDFRIGKGEVSNAQYAAFLNAVASTSDTMGLYSPLMASHFWGGIVRAGSAGQWSFAAKPGYADLPVTFVSFVDAVRYANWLHFGKPAGKAAPGITEGDSRIGSYDTTQRHPRRNAAATFVIPDCDEWAKAAYFDPATGRFSDWATQAETMALPASVSDNRGANVSGRTGFANPFPHLTSVTGYAPSRTGTFNQAGNVMEWVDSQLGDDQRVMGGSLFMNAASTRAGYADSEKPDHEIATFGFRIAKLDRASAAQSPAAIPAPPEFVRIGHAGNRPDLQTMKGFVGAEFEIQRTEISNEQYARFLNAVAAKDDPAGLFRKDMQDGIGGGIMRFGVPGAWRYSVKPGFGQRAANYISWFALARMANWRHFGSPVTGKSGPGTTEGDQTHGAYDTRGFPFGNLTDFDPAKVPGTRNPGARYFIPSDDEWYKAAYFDPEKPGRSKYWAYPTRSDAAPAQGGPGAANYQIGDRLGEGAPFFISEVQSFADSPGPMGTLQQGGNLWEWVEDWRSTGQGGCWRCDEWTKGLRGGSFNYTWRGLKSDNLDPATPGQAYFVHGGRLARAVSEQGWRPAPASQLDTLVWRVEKGVTGLSVKKWLAAMVLAVLLGAAGTAIFNAVRARSRLRHTAKAA